MRVILLATLLATASCSNYMSALKDGQYENNVALREMSYEIEELKLSLQQAHTEITALEDRVQTQERELLDDRHNAQKSSQIALLEKRLDELKAAHKSTLADLNSLNVHASKTSSSLTGYRDKILALENKVSAQESRLSEVVKLKKTLTSISSAMKAPPASPPEAKVYHVVAGDTLGKIANQNHTSVNKLKEVNNLNSNRIIVGQKLIIPQ